MNNALALVALTSIGIASAAGIDEAALARIPARMQQFVDQGTAAGFVTLVSQHGRIVSLKAVGYQDREANLPMRTDTIFRIKSMTKPMTVAALMTLVDEARVSLLDPVEQYLPEFKRLSSPKITIRDLMTHTSGIADPRGQATPKNLAERVSAIAGVKLASQPGEVWRYSNLGFASLGRIIEVVSGQPYETFLTERLLMPLGMNDTFFFAPPAKLNRVAAVYALDGDHRLNRAADEPPPAFPAPEGGLFSTAADQGRFYQMLMDKGTYNGHRILSAAAVRAMTTNQTGDLKGAEFSPGLGMGLGFGVVKEALGSFRYQSIGSFVKGGAYRTLGWGDPVNDLIGIIMFQRTNGGGDIAPETTAFVTLAEASVVP